MSKITYKSPQVNVVILTNNDIVTTSSNTENDGEWDEEKNYIRKI